MRTYSSFVKPVDNFGVQPTSERLKKPATLAAKFLPEYVGQQRHLLREFERSANRYTFFGLFTRLALGSELQPRPWYGPSNPSEWVAAATLMGGRSACGWKLSHASGVRGLWARAAGRVSVLVSPVRASRARRASVGRIGRACVSGA